MTKDELQVRNREIQDRMAEMNDKAYKEKREFTEEEQREWNALTREKTMNLDQLREMATDAELAKMREKEDKNAKLRELLKDNGQKREIVLTNDGSATSPVGVYSNSGAINLTIHELIPTLHEGLDLPQTLRIVTGVNLPMVMLCVLERYEGQTADELVETLLSEGQAAVTEFGKR